ncbi:unnamed protein product [Parascedosporium putredinis]|uniref:Uncharacterized protein n=1 Tax=Parascedosporium putredinis TaxID=1442378 RepID=A0A9P1MGW2_9PEZI|nr:unnamed protein product [Parascedosporium putredinis]CAI8005172.1 unnamed protein product [Parascedosporium putredinis]
MDRKFITRRPYVPTTLELITVEPNSRARGLTLNASFYLESFCNCNYRFHLFVIMAHNESFYSVVQWDFVHEAPSGASHPSTTHGITVVFAEDTAFIFSVAAHDSVI